MSQQRYIPVGTARDATVPWRGLRFLPARLALLGCAAVLAAGVGFALPTRARAATRGFLVENLSGYTLRLDSAGCTGKDSMCYSSFYPPFDSRPANGTLLGPGATPQDFQLVYYFAVENDVDASYTILDRDGHALGYFIARMNVAGGAQTSSACQVNAGSCSANDTTITYLDPPSTVHDIPAGQGQAQGAVLKQLCTTVTAAQCKFRPAGQIQVDTPSHQVGSALINNTDQTQDTTISTSDTVGDSNSVGVAISVETKFTFFGQELKTLIEASYGHTWTSSHAFTQSVSVHCPPHHRCAIFATQPMFRTTGDFSLTMGNTTWYLHDVSFDTPNPDGNGAYEVDSTPLTAAQRATLPRTFHVEKRLTGHYAPPTAIAARLPARARLRMALTLRGRRIDGASDGLADTARIALNASQPKRRLVYPVDDVVVRAWLEGHRARQWRIARLSFDHTRRLLLRFVVPPTVRGRVCLTVHATAPQAITARARVCAATSSLRISDTE